MLLTITCMLMIFPFLWAAMASTKPTDVAFANPPVFSYTPTFAPYIDLWQTTDFYVYLINTLVVAVISTLVALAIGLPCAYALSRYGGVASVVLLIMALIFRALPRFAVVLPMYEITKTLGIYDTTYAMAAALIVINQPFTIWLLRNFFAEIPKELDESAMVDGCTRIGVLRRVMLPLMGPGILTAGIFVFLFAFQEYAHRCGADRHQLQDGAGVHRHPDRAEPAAAAAGLGGHGAADHPGDRHRLHRTEVSGGRPELRRGQGLSLATPLVLLPGMNCSPGCGRVSTSAR